MSSVRKPSEIKCNVKIILLLKCALNRSFKTHYFKPCINGMVSNVAMKNSLLFLFIYLKFIFSLQLKNDSGVATYICATE